MHFAQILIIGLLDILSPPPGLSIYSHMDNNCPWSHFVRKTNKKVRHCTSNAQKTLYSYSCHTNFLITISQYCTQKNRVSIFISIDKNTYNIGILLNWCDEYIVPYNSCVVNQIFSEISCNLKSRVLYFYHLMPKTKW